MEITTAKKTDNLYEELKGEEIPLYVSERTGSKSDKEIERDEEETLLIKDKHGTSRNKKASAFKGVLPTAPELEHRNSSTTCPVEKFFFLRFKILAMFAVSLVHCVCCLFYFVCRNQTDYGISCTIC